MKPLITTVEALRELASGLSPDAVSSSPILFQHESLGVDVLISASDGRDSQRIILLRSGNEKERYVPEHLAVHRRIVLSRMASFAERARASSPLSLPVGWSQYKFGHLIAFFAVPGLDANSSRWIAEVLPGDRSDAVFWLTTTSSNKSSLEEFARSEHHLPPIEEEWESACQAAKQHFDHARGSIPSDVEISLAARRESTTKGWSYEQWLGAVSPDQRAFIEAKPNKSIRLRGPAGSGKTLALTMKAVREVLEARHAGEALRVLVVTHSWALAAQIQDSVDSMGLGLLNEIDAFPLLEVAKNVSPHYLRDTSGFHLIGEDSYSGKRAQLDEIRGLLDEFVAGDWITYQSQVSDALRSRFDSTDEDDRLALAWDLLIEFGSVLGASAIFPGVGSDLRYFHLSRAGWMLPLITRGDMRVVFDLYVRYMKDLEKRSMVTSDQVLADFLNHLETHAWNRARRSDGYDLVFVDEFHLFSPLERQVLHYLTRDVSAYPCIFMALDPRQSPSEAFIGLAADVTRSSASARPDEGLGDVTNFELTTVHRFTPQILQLVKHVHHKFPTFDLGHDWDIDFSSVESAKDEGPVPQVILSGTRAAEESDLAHAVHDLYGAGRVAIAVVDGRQWPRFSEFASRIAQSGKYRVSTISGRSDIEGLGYRRRGVVVAPVEYLAGLQFDTVLVTGIPDLQLPSNERSRLLSFLYLALSRAERDVRIHVNEDDGGAPEVLLSAVTNGHAVMRKGNQA